MVKQYKNLLERNYFSRDHGITRKENRKSYAYNFVDEGSTHPPPPTLQKYCCIYQVFWMCSLLQITSFLNVILVVV